MLNKEEVKYNVASLVSTWLYGVKDIPEDVYAERVHAERLAHNTETTIDCDNLGEVVSQLSNVLIDNAEKYTKATLIGVVGEKDKKFGELDII